MEFECLYPDQIIKLGLIAMRAQSPPQFASFIEVKKKKKKKIKKKKKKKKNLYL